MRRLCVFTVYGFEACPWSVPFIGRNGGSFVKKKSRPDEGILNLPDWQAKVKAAAELAMAEAESPVHLGPIKLHIEFFTATPPGRKHGEIWNVGVRWNPDTNKGRGAWVKVRSRKGKSDPDITNLIKGTEDAIENVSYGNDVQTCIISSSKWFGPDPGVKVTVWAIEPGDFPGSGEPIPVEVKRAKSKRRVARG